MASNGSFQTAMSAKSWIKVLETNLEQEKYEECHAALASWSLATVTCKNYEHCVAVLKYGFLKIIEKLLVVTHPLNIDTSHEEFNAKQVTGKSKGMESKTETIMSLRIATIRAISNCCDTISLATENCKTNNCTKVSLPPNCSRCLSKCIVNMFLSTFDYSKYAKNSKKLCIALSSLEMAMGFNSNNLYNSIALLFDYVKINNKGKQHNSNICKQQKLLVKNVTNCISPRFSSLVEQLTVCSILNDNILDLDAHLALNIFILQRLFQILVAFNKKLDDKQQVSLIVYSKFLDNVATQIKKIDDRYNIIRDITDKEPRGSFATGLFFICECCYN